jgi:methionine-rich copper-binding protein CopC
VARSTGFRFPLGTGFLTEIAGDSDGFHVEANFNYYNPEFNAYHIGEDWNADTGGNTDLGLPVYAISNGTVVERGVSEAFGNYVIIRHDLPEPITVGGVTTSTVYSFYGHFQNPALVTVGQDVAIGQQIGNMGYTGMADGNAHVHLEIRLGYGVGYQNMDGYSFNPSPTGWVDPTDFINAYRDLGDAGNTMATARVVMPTSTIKTFSDYVGPTDTSDYFKFTNTDSTNFALSLTGLTEDADVYLLDAQGVEVAHSYNFGPAAEAINISKLAAGTYYVQVRPYGDASTYYSLKLSATPVDATAPLLSKMTPADNATAVALNSNLVLTFNEAVSAGSGDIVLYNANGTVAKSIAVTDTSQVSFSGNTVTINPTSDLAAGSSYYVNIGAGVITDAGGNSYAGISDTTAFNFSTVAPVDKAGNTMAAAKLVTLGGTPSSFNDYVGPADTNDYYKFITTGPTKFALSMTGLTGDADVYLLNSQGVEVAHSYNAGTAAEAINLNSLAAGTYYVQVKPYNGASANYNLSFSATVADTKAPLLSSMTPADNSTAVAVDKNLVLTFNEAVTAGTGNITLYKSNGTVAKSIAVTDTSQVSFSGNTVTINPTGDLTGNSSYYVNVATGAIKDLAGNSYAGISGSTAFNFTTVNPPDTAGNTTATARAVTVGNTHTIINDYVGPTDTNDYFKFTTTGPTKFDLGLNGLSADADVYLFNSKGAEVAHSYNVGTAAEAIHIANLAADTYFVQVHAYQNASTHYALDLFGTPA